ncbi:transporter [Vulgatibacter sp.]|uniref:SphA family protein n=1 Tax=Vulgatibacter sp. TaxID=1971226 RepID=UPI003569BACF
MKQAIRSCLSVGLALAAAAALALPGLVHAQQQLGNKVLGTAGIDAGSQRPPGLYLADRFAWYHANELVDREGAEVPVGLDLDVVANAIGLALTLEIAPIDTFVNLSVAVPVARIRSNTERPEASVDNLGFADLYVQPLGLGWQLPGADLVTSYGFYAPTGRSAPGSGGVGRGQWTHQFSAGGTIYLATRRSWRFSLLGSYERNQKKRDVDITRGDTLQLQGGFGGPVHPAVNVGLAGYALWQVEDDSGADLPPILRGARDRAFGVGPEVSVLVPPIRSRFGARYEHDLSVRSRPWGGILLLEFTFLAWSPER